MSPSVQFSGNVDFADGWTKKHRNSGFDLRSRPKVTLSVTELAALIEEKRLRARKRRARGDMTDEELATFRSASGPWKAENYFWNADMDDASRRLASKYLYGKFAADGAGMVRNSLYGAQRGRLIPRKYLVVFNGLPYDARTLARDPYVRGRNHTLGFGGTPLTDADLTRIHQIAAR